MDEFFYNLAIQKDFLIITQNLNAIKEKTGTLTT